MKERIQKVLANAGVDSRRAIEEMVLMGRVSVNGEIRKELPILVNPEKDEIEVDGEPVRLKIERATKRVYVLMNKPKGVYCTNVAQGAQRRAIDLLPVNFPYRVYPVGRLDADSRGLLLLTNDGDLTNQLTHPKYGISKTYIAEVEGYVSAEVIEELNKGIWLADKAGHGFKTMPSHVKILNRNRDSSSLEISIREGRNRQVRRMLSSLNHEVKRLTRVQMGRLTLQGVGPGKWRFLTTQEVRSLQSEVKKARQRVTDEAAEAAETTAAPASPARPKSRKVLPGRPDPAKRRTKANRPPMERSAAQPPARPGKRPSPDSAKPTRRRTWFGEGGE